MLRLSNFRIVIKVKSIEGYCPVYELGDTILLEEFYIKSNASPDVCMHAFSSMISIVSAFSKGVSASEMGIGKKDEVGFLQCPDPGKPLTEGGTVIFEIRREEKNK